MHPFIVSFLECGHSVPYAIVIDGDQNMRTCHLCTPEGARREHERMFQEIEDNWRD